MWEIAALVVELCPIFFFMRLLSVLQFYPEVSVQLLKLLGTHIYVYLQELHVIIFLWQGIASIHLELFFPHSSFSRKKVAYACLYTVHLFFRQVLFRGLGR